MTMVTCHMQFIESTRAGRSENVNLCLTIGRTEKALPNFTHRGKEPAGPSRADRVERCRNVGFVQNPNPAGVEWCCQWQVRFAISLVLKLMKMLVIMHHAVERLVCYLTRYSTIARDPWLASPFADSCPGPRWRVDGAV